jgi:predicted dehydrogenase
MSDIYSVDYTTNLEELLNDEKINGVVIVTPSSTHYDLSKLALMNGKDVFVEKPITLKSKNAKKLVELAEEKEKILMVGHLFRYHPLVKHIKERIDIGEFGKIEMILTYRFALGVPRKDMGVIFALAVHDLDLACYLLCEDEPKSILVDNGQFHQDEVIEMTNISLDFNNKTKAYMMESWNIPVYGKKRELVLIGSEKSAIIDYLNPSEYKIFDARIKKKTINNQVYLEKENDQVNRITIDYKEPLKQEILHFIKSVKDQKKPESDGLVGYHAVRMCEKAFQSAKEDKRVYF